MKKLLSILLTILLIISIVPLGTFTFTASAATSGTTGDCTWSLDGTVLTISGNGEMADYTYSYNFIPPWGSNITEVIIESGVTSIGKSAFCHCSKLENIYISDSITSINNYAFHDCSNLININIPDGVTAIGYEVFSGCSNLTNVTIPNSVTSIGNWAFSGCKNLKNVYISDIAAWCGINYNGNNSSNPLSYADNLYLNNKLLTDVIIPQGVTTIPYEAFDSVNITSVSIPDSVVSIGGYAFSGCKKLLDIQIPSSVISIGGGAFYNCQNLVVITLPDSVKNIGNAAFEYCYNLTDVYYGGSYRERYENIVVDYDDNLYLSLAKWHYAREDNLVYSYDDKNFTAQVIDCNYSVDSIQIPSTVTKNEKNYEVTSIGNYAFSNRSKLKNITISNNITSIGYEAFSYCSSLENVYITDVGAWCKIFFENAKSNPLYYADKLFVNKQLITQVIIPEDITRIYSYTFLNCRNVISVVIPSSVTVIGNEAFNGCSHLKYVYYCGSFEERYENLIIADSMNSKLTSTQWYYDICKLQEHVYKNDCDSTCSDCEYIRETAHVYGNDNTCNVCSFTNYDISKLFPDAQKNAWYSEAVTYVVGYNLMKGYSNGKFGTSDGIQRQDFLVMLARFDGVDLTQYGYDCNMPDVARDSYYEAAVNWGVEKGITTGYESGKFGVGDKITREQLVTFLYRYAKYKNIDVENVTDTKAKAFPDYNTVTDFAEAPIIWAIDKGVINGKSGYIAPQGNAQRCEIAQIMYNIFQKDIF